MPRPRTGGAPADPETIVFDSDREGSPDVYLMRGDGRDVLRLVRDPAFDVFADLSPDGREVVFMSNRDGNYELYAMGVDGTNERRLTDTPEWDEGHTPRFSPDAGRLLFSRSAVGGKMDSCDVLVLDLGTEALTSLTEGFEGRDGQAAWSPDGAHVAFVSDRSGTDELYVARADGSEIVALTDNPGADHWPAWSPDGTRIAYTSEAEPGAGGELRVLALDRDAERVRGVLEERTIFDAEPAAYPSWRPDGRRIAFQASPGGNSEVWAVDADGAGFEALTDTAFSSRHPSWGRTLREPPVEGDVVVRTHVEGWKRSEFAGSTFPFEWSGAAGLSDAQWDSLAGGAADESVAGAVLDAFVEPGGRREEGWLTVEGGAVTGHVTVWSRNGGPQGTLEIAADLEGEIGAGSLRVDAVRAVATATWDYGEGPQEVPAGVEEMWAERPR